MVVFLLSVISLIAASTADDIIDSDRAPRICRPSPTYTSANKTCLIIGDSVSIGYTSPLTPMMRSSCDLLHAPYSSDGGACDTRYGLQCGEMWLSQSLGGQGSPRYDVITFNFGLHDTNDEGKDEEARDEYVPLPEHTANVVKFLSLIRKLQPQAKVAWLTCISTTMSLRITRLRRPR